MQLRHAARTDAGRTRDHNEDTYAIEAGADRPEAGALFVVCDGMGGFAAGEVASELAADTITARYSAAIDSNPGDALRAAFVEANARVFKRGRGKMGTTGVAALFLDDVMLVANVGDSRAYLIRDGTIRQLTRDHSLVADQVSAGVITEDQARESSYRNIITRALGHRPEVEVDLYQEAVRPGDRVLLCSDGLHGLVEPHELARLAGSGPLERIVKALIALANDRGGTDNITAVLVEVVTIDSADGGPSPAARTDRMNTLPEERVPPAGTASLSSTKPRASADPGQRGREAAHTRPGAAPPLAPSAGSVPVRRAPILGLIVMTLLALGFLGAMVWFVLTSEPASAPLAYPPPLATLVPSEAATSGPATVTPASPTLVPTGTSPPGITSSPASTIPPAPGP